MLASPAPSPSTRTSHAMPNCVSEPVAASARERALESRLEILEFALAAQTEKVEKLKAVATKLEALTSLPEQLERLALLVKQLPAADGPSSPQFAPKSEPSVEIPAKAGPPVEYHRIFSKIDPTTIPKFNGSCTASELVRWLLTLPTWVADIGLASEDDLFSGTHPVIRRFLAEPTLSWFVGRQDDITSYSAFFKAVCKHILRSNYEAALEQVYIERVMQPGEGPMEYVIEKERLASVCFFGRAGSLESIWAANDGMIQGLLPPYRPIAIVLLKIDPFMPADDLGQELRKLELAESQHPAMENAEAKQSRPAAAITIDSQTACRNCGSPVHRSMDCPQPCPHCKRSKHTWSKCTSNPRASEYVLIRRSDLDALNIKYTMEEWEDGEFPLAKLHIPPVGDKPKNGAR